MIQARSALDADWRDAIGMACAADGGENLSVFAEERHDIVVEADSVAAGAEAIVTRTAGLNVSQQAGGESRYLAGARPEDLRLLLSGRKGAPVSPTDSSAGLAQRDEADCRIPVTTVEKTLNLLDSQFHALRSRVRWVGFRQQMWTHCREEPVGEIRRAGRLRIEVEARAGDPLTAELAFKGGRSPSDAAVNSLIDGLLDRIEPFQAASAGRSGEFEVVLAPGLGGILAHELIGHALEADTVLDGRSWLTQLEESRLPPRLTVLDDPRRGRAAWQLDDEGESAVPTVLLRDGRIGEWLHDLSSARRCRRSSNGHGRRASFRDPVRPRMGCTFITNGRLEAEEIVSAVGDGIYVRRMESATTDPSTGRASFRVGDADRIVNGKIEQALKPHLLIVDGAQTLTRLDQTGNDLAFDTCIGGCHRDGQPLAVSVGAPIICIGMVKVVF